MIELLISILIIVESNGNPNAIGDDGNAVGILQMHKCVIDDVNKFYNKKYSYDDRYNESKSRAIATYYLHHWGEVYQRQTNKKPTIEIYSRIWNGGAKGWKKESTIKYWNKVKQEMEVAK